jgi:hypothetical protein
MHPTTARFGTSAIAMVSTALLATPAHAGVGAWITAPGQTWRTDHTTIVVARRAESTLWTFQLEVSGDATQAIFVLPVPGPAAASTPSLVAAEVMDDLNAATAPILLGAGCEHLYPSAELEDTGPDGPSKSLFGRFEGRGPCGCLADTRTDPNPAWPAGWFDTGLLFEPPTAPVIAEAHETRPSSGQFEFQQVDSAASLTDAIAALGGTLDEPLLSELTATLADGQHLLIARITLPEAPADPIRLPAFQYTTSATANLLPLLTHGSTDNTGSSTVITLAPSDLGRATLSGVERRAVSDNCLLPQDAPEFSTFVDEHLRAQLALAGGDVSRWTIEGSGSAAACDPCGPSETCSESSAQALGWTESLDGLSWTRIRIHHGSDPPAAALTFSGLSADTRLSFLRYEPRLESDFPICGQGYAEDPGTCVAAQGSNGDSEEANAGGLALGALALSLSLYARKRRDQA